MVPSKNGMLDAVCSSSTSDAATSSRRPSDAALQEVRVGSACQALQLDTGPLGHWIIAVARDEQLERLGRSLPSGELILFSDRDGGTRGAGTERAAAVFPIPSALACRVIIGFPLEEGSQSDERFLNAVPSALLRRVPDSRGKHLSPPLSVRHS